MNVFIKDNFLSDYQCDSIDNILSSHTFPWYFKRNLNGPIFPGNFYFYHSVIADYKVTSQHLSVFTPILDQIEVPIEKVKRIKANLSTRTQKRYHHEPHIDYPSNSQWTTLCYYVNSTNGPTIFNVKPWWKRVSIEGKRNRVVFFDGSFCHHSTTSTNTNYRITINIDYERPS